MSETKVRAMEIPELGGLLILHELSASKMAKLLLEHEVRPEDEVVLTMLTMSVRDQYNRDVFSEAHFKELREKHDATFSRLLVEVAALQM